MSGEVTDGGAGERPTGRVVLHVGAPKSGTTFLQRSMWARRQELLGAGVGPVGREAREMFHAAIEVRGTAKFWQLDRDALDGTWARLCAQAREASGTVVMSHELLAAAGRERAQRARAELDGAEVHLVFTARDLGRQVPSEWQERVKNGGTSSFASFQEGLLEEIRAGSTESTFWRAHDVIDVVDRWGEGLPPEQVHVVVAPASGTGPEVLWRRFAEAVGFDGERIGPDVAGAPSNQTLGAVQVGLLREVNLALDGRIPQPHYARFVKRYFSQGLLARQRSTPARCSPELLEELVERARVQAEAIRARGFTVHGDLAELVPTPRGASEIDPDAIDPELRAAAATEAVADLLEARVPRERRGRAARQAPPTPRTLSARVRGRVLRGLRGRR